MPIFQPRNRVTIIRQMVARVVGRSKLVGLTRNSVIFHMIAAASDEDGEQYFQMARLRELFSIDRATGSDLDERAKEIQPATIVRRTAIFGSTLATFSRPGTVGLVNIPEGTLVAARDQIGIIQYRTTAATSIIGGNTLSTPVNVTAVEAGARGNVPATEIQILVTSLPGVTGVTNAAAITNARDRESDQRFRARLKAFIQAISRGTKTALRGFALNVQLQDGRLVLFAKVDEPNPPNGTVNLYIDDGTGQIGAATNKTTIVNDIIVSGAVGDETDINTTEKPIDDTSPFELRLDRGGITILTRGTDYELNAPLGQITFKISANFPSGVLVAGDDIQATYTHWTGLVQETQKVIDGVAADAVTFPGVRAAGITVFVLPATAIDQTLEANVAVLDEFDAVEVIASVQTAIINYINNLDIGDNVIISQIIEDAMRVPGAFDFKITSYKSSTTVTNQVIPANSAARVLATSNVIIT